MCVDAAVSLCPMQALCTLPGAQASACSVIVVLLVIMSTCADGVAWFLEGHLQWNLAWTMLGIASIAQSLHNDAAKSQLSQQQLAKLDIRFFYSCYDCRAPIGKVIKQLDFPDLRQAIITFIDGHSKKAEFLV